MTDKEINRMKIELVETADLIDFTIKTGLPISSTAFHSLIDRVRTLRQELAVAEAELMKSLYHQIQSN